MSTNISKQKREDLLAKIKEIRTFISAAPQDENTGNLLAYLSDLEKDVNGKKYGLVFEEHREDIDEEVIFAAELIGVEVFADGESIGKIKEVLDYPSHSVYVIRGKYEYMIPAVKQFILSTDVEANRMEVRPIEGMRSDEN